MSFSIPAEKNTPFMGEKHNILLHDYNFTFASNKQQIVLRMSYFKSWKYQPSLGIC